MLSFSQARWLEICNTQPGDCASVCSRSGIGMFWTLLRVIVWVICASHGTCGVAAVFCAALISSSNSSSSPRQEVSRMSAFHLGQVSRRTRERQIRLVFAVISMRMSVIVCIQRLKFNLAGDRIYPNSVFHSLVGEKETSVQIRSFTILLFALIFLWRLCSKTIILVRDLHIAHVHELF